MLGLGLEAGAVWGTSSTITSAGTTVLRAGSLKEMVRYRFVTDIFDESPFSWLHLRMLRPSWESNIETTAASTPT